MTPDALQVPELVVTEEDMEVGLELARATPGCHIKTQGDCNFAARLAATERHLREAYAIIEEKDKERETDIRVANRIIVFNAKRAESAEIELSTLKAAAEAMTAANEALRKELEALRESSAKARNIGSQMSNVIYNLAQDKTRDEHEQKMMRNLVKEWDDVRSLIPATERSTN